MKLTRIILFVCAFFAALNCGAYIFNCLHRPGVSAQCSHSQLIQKAQAGDPAAQCELGARYLDGDGFMADTLETLKWFHRSADQGYSRAQFMLGLCYQNGIGENQSFPRAVACFQKAADQGLSPAQFELAACYQTGRGIPADQKLALQWLQKSANRSAKTKN